MTSFAAEGVGKRDSKLKERMFRDKGSKGSVCVHVLPSIEKFSPSIGTSMTSVKGNEKRNTKNIYLSR